jgi:membrane-bound lytic murein transglycosylase B
MPVFRNFNSLQFINNCNNVRGWIMKMSFTTLISSIGILTFTVGLAGCDSIPVYDPSKIPWQQQPRSGVPVGTIPESNPVDPTNSRGSTGSTGSSRTTSSTPNRYEPNRTGEGDYIRYPALRRFIAEMNKKHKFSLAFLNKTFKPIRRSDEVLGKVRAPAEGKAWRAYRPIFLTEDRIRGGVDFWNRHRSALNAATKKFGVPAEYIVAIIGVETAYGRNVGKYNVLRSLTTLAFDFPKRGDFYRSELEQFLLLTRTEKINPYTLTGSYAGAMGMSQFISSSYRHYAIDFDRDGKKDLWRPADAIGSVANYFSKHGWKRGGDVAVPTILSGASFDQMADVTAKKPRYSLDQLSRAGVRPSGQWRFWSDKVSLIKLVGTRDVEYWIGGKNFYVITRYNHSPKYAMAVHQLAQEILRRH